MKRVLQVMDYAAPYPGSFMGSLDALGSELRKSGGEQVYVFPARARKTAAAKWIGDMAARGCHTYFLSGEVTRDAGLLRDVVRKHEIGIVHTHFEDFRIDLAVYLATLFSGVKRVRHIRNHLPPGSLPKNLIKRAVFRGCDFIGVSEAVGEGVRKRYPRNRCYAIDNGIQYGRLDDCKELKRTDFGFDDASTVCFMMGYDFKLKGIDLVLEAVKALRSRFDVNLMISVSSNVEGIRAGIEQQLGSMPEWVVLLPPRNDIASYYRLADVFISASREEGFCNALVEAAYCERMAVASKIPAQGDLKIPHVFWFRPGDAQDLARRLAEAIARKGRYEAELKSARAAVQREYDVGLWAQKIVSIYENGQLDHLPQQQGRAQPI